LDDTAHQERADGELVYAGMGVGVVRLIGATLFFLRRRRDAVAA
jgi:nitrate reductase gamma subunit